MQNYLAEPNGERIIIVLTIPFTQPTLATAKTCTALAPRYARRSPRPHSSASRHFRLSIKP